MVIVRNYQKWKEHDEISTIFNFEVTDVKVPTSFPGLFPWRFGTGQIAKGKALGTRLVKVRHFTVILMFKKLRRLMGKKLLCHPAYKSFIIFKLSSCPKILHLHVSGLIYTLVASFQPCISNHDHLLLLSRSRAGLCKEPILPTSRAQNHHRNRKWKAKDFWESLKQ